MKIALLTDGIWPFVIGGMQKHSYYLCKYFAKRGIYVDLYYTTSNGMQADLSEVLDETLLKFINPLFIRFPESDKLPGHYIRSSFKYSELIFQKYLASAGADVIYAQGLTARAFFKRKQNSPKLPPVCINVHGYEYFQKAASLRSTLEQYLLRGPFKYVNEQADYIFSFGGKITRIIESNIKNRRGKIIEISAGIEAEFVADKIREANETVQFVYLGRYERRKGIDELMKAIRGISDGPTGFHFHFIGDIPPEYRMDLPHITYHGVLDKRYQIKDILLACDVLVCPSYAEGMPNVILEAMACGCAVIATDVGAVPLHVTAENGWLIPPGSVNALKTAMREVLDMPKDELQFKRCKSFEMVRQNFLWDHIIDELVVSLRQIIQTEGAALKDAGGVLNART